jgi:hypothetical protein
MFLTSKMDGPLISYHSTWLCVSEFEEIIVIMQTFAREWVDDLLLETLLSLGETLVLIRGGRQQFRSEILERYRPFRQP